jgi:hypothetical protein
MRLTGLVVLGVLAAAACGDDGATASRPDGAAGVGGSTWPDGGGPSCSDGVVNGDESGVDCGGSCPPCCTTSTYEKSTGPVSGTATVCCDGSDARIAVAPCGTGQNYTAEADGASCAKTSEGPNNGGSACVSVTCETLDCGAGDGGPPPPPPYGGPASAEVWSMAGVFVYDPKTFDPDTFGPVLKQHQFGWVALQIIDGTTEKWPCTATPCGKDTARGFIAAWRAHVKWVGAWGVNRANADQAAVQQEADAVVDLIDAYDSAGDNPAFYIADAEAEYEYSKCGACVSASDWWSARFRERRPESAFQAALSSWGRTDRADVYYMSWRDRGFHFLPQTYWNDPNQGSDFTPALGVDYAKVCPGSQDAIDKQLDCAGSPTDCPCWPVARIHPTIGFGWGQNPPTEADYVASLKSANATFGSVGLSIFEGQYVPAGSPAWAAFGQAVADGAALAP